MPRGIRLNLDTSCLEAMWARCKDSLGTNAFIMDLSLRDKHLDSHSIETQPLAQPLLDDQADSPICHISFMDYQTNKHNDLSGSQAAFNERCCQINNASV